MKKFLSMALALAMIFSFAAFASAEETLVLGTSADYPPFEFMYLDDAGEMVYGGIDVSAAGYIAEQMGKELVVENMSFDYLLVALAKGDYDIVMAAIEDTPERENAADFSDPYYTDMPPMILIRAADAEQYKTLNDFSGKAVGAQTATRARASPERQAPPSGTSPGDCRASVPISADRISRSRHPRKTGRRKPRRPPRPSR